MNLNKFFKGNIFDRTNEKREKEATAPPEPVKQPEKPSSSDFFYGSPDDLRKKRKTK